VKGPGNGSFPHRKSREAGIGNRGFPTGEIAKRHFTRSR
jgi:hypothetical protein